MTNIVEYADLSRRNAEAYRSLAEASGLELRAIVELAEQDNLAAAVRLVEARSAPLTGRQALLRVMKKRRPHG